MNCALSASHGISYQILPERSLAAPAEKSLLPSSSTLLLGHSKGTVSSYLWHKSPHLHRSQYPILDVCLLEFPTRRTLYVAETLSETPIAPSKSPVRPRRQEGEL